MTTISKKVDLSENEYVCLDNSSFSKYILRATMLAISFLLYKNRGTVCLLSAIWAFLPKFAEAYTYYIMEIGDKVRFLNDVGGGIIVGFEGNNLVIVKDDTGFDVPVLRNELVVIDTNQ